MMDVILNKNIVLTGFMATGKSAVGRRLACNLDRTFVDIDAEIESEAGLSIPDIFDLHGEPFFRMLETEVIRNITERERLVIATGGGAIMKPLNRTLLEKNGVLICLTARLDTLVERTRNCTKRPLLQDTNVVEKMRTLLQERRPLYADIPLQVYTDNRSIQDVTDAILKLLHFR